MALGASLSFAAARAGIVGGLGVADLIFARFVVAGAIMLPPLLYWGLPTLAGIGLKRAVILTMLGGAPFALLQTGGYGFAPLAHGAVIAPSTVTIVSTIGAAIFLRERLGPAHLAGAAIVLLGIGLIGWDGIAQSAAKSGERAWIGDLLFFASSLLWAGFTLLLRHWRLSALRATAVVAVLSMVVTTPVYLLWMGVEHLMALADRRTGLSGPRAGWPAGRDHDDRLQPGGRPAGCQPRRPVSRHRAGGVGSGRHPDRRRDPGTLQIAGLVLVTIGLLITIGFVGRLRIRT